ncbi:MAG: mechanosensitive ion channel family protein [Acidimicrobiia bacterium]|nr:mechanosensitive ion channel family protein [Acidimicrobiia bacterium]
MDVLGWLGDYQGEVIRSGAVIAVSLLAWWLVVRLGDRAVERYQSDEDLADRERSQRVSTLWRAGRRAVAIVAIVILILTVLLIWGIPVTPLVAVASAVGLAVGFGAQAFVKDLISGFFILAERQFDIGDVVRLAGVSGKVEDIRLRVTVLRDLDGIVHYIPNGEITVASNITQEFSKVVIDVPVAYGSDLARVHAVLSDELASFDTDVEWAPATVQPSELLGVDQLGDSGIVFRAVLTLDPDQRWPAKREFLRRIAVRFEAEGIVIPFPQIRVHMTPAGGETP